MSESYEGTRLQAALEAMLFVTNEPVNALVLADMLDIEVARAEQGLRDLAQRLEASESGIQLREVAGGWRLYTHPAYHELIERYVLSWDTRKLSAAAMETLAIIAYTQPVTRSGVAQIRGVNSDSTISSLVEKRLVREVGTADTPGNPSLYGTTHAFLEKFGLKGIADLPPLDDFAPDEETRRLIAERLSATRSAGEVSEAQAYMMAEEMLYGEGDKLIQDGSGSDADAGGEGAGGQTDTDDSAEVIDDAFRQAIASTLGVVEKIDLDKLRFDFDDE